MTLRTENHVTDDGYWPKHHRKKKEENFKYRAKQKALRKSNPEN